MGMATCSSALLVEYSVDRFVRAVPAIVAGKVIAVEQAESRELGYRSCEGWLFPHAAAEILVHEVLKNTTARLIAAGDTISLIFPTSDCGSKEGTNVILWVEDVPQPAFVEDQSGVFALKVLGGEWRLGSHYCFRDANELEEIRAAIQLHAVREAESEEK